MHHDRTSTRQLSVIRAPPQPLRPPSSCCNSRWFSVITMWHAHLFRRGGRNTYLVLRYSCEELAAQAPITLPVCVRDTETFKDHAVSITFIFEGADCAILHHHNGSSLVKGSAARGETVVLLRLGDQIEFFITSDFTNDEYMGALRWVRVETLPASTKDVKVLSHPLPRSQIHIIAYLSWQPSEAPDATGVVSNAVR